MNRKTLRFSTDLKDLMIPSENTSKIVSTLEHLFPNTWEEQVVIKCGSLSITETEDFKTHLVFNLNSTKLNFPEDKIPQIEFTLKNKIEIIFRWFPVYAVSSVKIVIVNE